MYRKLGRDSSARKALFRSMLTSFFQYERIETTEAKAKELRSLAEQMVTLAKRGDLHARRQAATFVRNEVASVREEDESIVVESALQKLFNDLGPRFAERQGGYTRILKTEPRRGDAAPMVVIEFVK